MDIIQFSGSMVSIAVCITIISTDLLTSIIRMIGATIDNSEITASAIKDAYNTFPF